MTRLIYEIALLVAGLWYLPYAFATRRITYSFKQRLGFHADSLQARLGNRDAIWVHAASVGEVLAAQPLIETIRSRSQRPFVFSVVTETGYRTAERLAGDGDVVVHLPFDLAWCVRRAFGHARPAMCLVMETEVWPNFWQLWLEKGVPIAIVNGRISDRAWPRYQWVKSWIAPVLSQAAVVCAQTEEDVQRFCALGAPADRVHVTGNLKFDVSTDEPRIVQQAEELRRAFRLQSDDQLLVAGSTHPGEEEILLDVYQRLRCRFPRLRLLIAPRHPQRAGEVANVARKLGYAPALRTQGGDSEVMLLDTIGELVAAYSLATVVFVGGSLVRHGGQNPIEPALFAKPILTGPHVQNFQAIFDQFFTSQAAQRISAASDLERACDTLLGDPVARDALGHRARALLDRTRGATDHILKLIEGCLTA